MPLPFRRALPAALVALSAAVSAPPADAMVARGATPKTTVATAYVVKRLSAPARSVVTDARGAWVATFTDGARTAALAGPARRFTEASAGSAVTSSTWVRVLPKPFAGTVDLAWLAAARADATPDVLATSMQYLAGRPDRFGADGLLLAADASYGPLQPDGTREAGADWNDFQGVVATYGAATDTPEADEVRSVDCSGFMRLLWGRRFGIPVGLDPDGGASLPRRAAELAASAPGVVPVADAGRQVTDYSRLQPGDLVFFDAATADGAALDHVGLYLGKDEGGHQRFISSRVSADGPTMGDYRGASLLDGTGLYARGFRATRRL